MKVGCLEGGPLRDQVESFGMRQRRVDRDDNTLLGRRWWVCFWRGGGRCLRVVDAPDEGVALRARTCASMQYSRRRWGGAVIVGTRLRSGRMPGAAGAAELHVRQLLEAVATALDQPSLSARDIAEYLGHANPSLTMNTYMS